MKTRQTILWILLAGAALVLAGCAGSGISIDKVPDKARGIITQQTAGGKIDVIKMEKEGDAVFYEVKYNKDGRKHEMVVSEAGEITKTEEHMNVEEVPAAVRATIDIETRGGSIKEIERETKQGATYYEVEFEKDGMEKELHIAEDGKVLEKK